jgi:hypothetical protein
MDAGAPDSEQQLCPWPQSVAPWHATVRIDPETRSNA